MKPVVLLSPAMLPAEMYQKPATFGVLIAIVVVSSRIISHSDDNSNTRMGFSQAVAKNARCVLRLQNTTGVFSRA
jgi:hypothetical protein